MDWRAVSLCLLACCWSASMSNAAVISIDFGSEWVKVALVKPGVPMETVINKESKRKTAAVVSLRNDERLFGDAALNTAVKYPKSAYRYLQLLVGQKYSSPLVEMYKKWFPWYEIVKDDERGTVLFQHDADTLYSPEELIAMIFNHSRQFAQDYADNTPIRDVIITVPVFYSQAQRRAMLRSAELVGLNVLQLMSDNAAAALNYGVFRQNTFNNTAQNVMFYDMGALSATATIVEYRKVQVKEGGVANVHPQLAVKGTGYDRTLGGLEMDLRLRDHLAKIFEGQKKTQGSVFDSPRAMAKLLKEAKRVKQVLSANMDHSAQVEGLLEDVDFKARVTRGELEELYADLFDRVGGPVTQALEAADMTMDEIDSVILVGGGTRMPKVQETLLKVVNKPELGKSLNTDEAVALGAVYQAAGHSKMFRVKKFIVKEGAVFPIQVSFTRVSMTEAEEGEEPQEVTKVVKRTLFHRSNAYPQKKVLTFNRYSDDFSFQVFYGDLDFLSAEEKSYLGRLNISEVYLAGVREVMADNPHGDHKGVKAHFRMDESGVLNLDNVECVFEYPEEGKPEEESTFSKLSSAFSSFFGGSEGKEEPGADTEDAVESPSETTPTDTPTSETDRTDESDSDETTPTGDEEERTRDREEEEEEDKSEDSSVSDGETTDNSEEGGVANEETESGADEGDEGQQGGNEDQPSEDEDVPVEGADDDTDEGVEGQQNEGAEDGGQDEGAEPAEAGGESTDTPTSEGVDTNTTTSDTVPPSNTTSGGKAKKKKTKAPPKENVVKVNLTAEVTVLDLPPPSEGAIKMSMDKLEALQRHDDEKAANEQARNNLESHIFETKDAMYSDLVMSVSTKEQREAILSALTEAGDWMEDEGYFAETKTYKDKLRELKRASRALFKRVEEFVRRPKYLEAFNVSLNVSRDFLFRMKNLTEDLQIFTEVEISKLESLINETEEWRTQMVTQQDATPLHEDPVLLCYDIEEHAKHLDREVMYLLNKLRSHPPPRPKTKANATNTTTDTGGDSADSASGPDSDADSSSEHSSDADSAESDESTSSDEPTTTSADTDQESTPPESDRGDSTTTEESPDKPLEEPDAGDEELPKHEDL